MTQEVIKGGFRWRNLPINADYRPMYKIGLIILILKLACRGGKSSLNKLHFLVWSLKSEKNMASIRLAFMAHNISTITSWGVEPALNKALHLAYAEELIGLTDDKYSLTPKGLVFSKELEKNADLFEREKPFLTYIGKQKVTEDFINKLTDNLFT